VYIRRRLHLVSDQLSDAKSPAPNPGIPGLAEAFRLSYATVSPVTRRVVSGVLLGASVALIVAMLGVGSLDTALLVALAAFGFGIPFLLLGLCLSLVDLDSLESSGPATSDSINSTNSRDSLDWLRPSLRVAFIALEGYGTLTLLIGIGAVLWHFGSGFLLVLAAGTFTSLLLFVVYTITLER
jgi:hypothetical protein